MGLARSKKYGIAVDWFGFQVPNFRPFVQAVQVGLKGHSVCMIHNTAIESHGVCMIPTIQ